MPVQVEKEHAKGKRRKALHHGLIEAVIDIRK